MENEIDFHLKALCNLFKAQLSKEIENSITKAIKANLNSFSNDPFADKLLATSEVEKLLGLSKSTINKLKTEGMPFIKVGDSVRFCKSKVLDFIQQKYEKREGGNVG